MADATEQKTEKVKKKKLRPTNCVQSNKRIRRKNWYYREGNFFANKQAYKAFKQAQLEKKAKEAAEKQQKAPEAPAAQA